MQEFQFVPHVLFPLSSPLISSPTAVILSRQSLTARFAESRYSFLVCVCECVCECAGDGTSRAGACVPSSRFRSILQSGRATVSAQAEEGSRLVEFQINPRLSVSDRPLSALPLSSAPSLSLSLSPPISSLTLFTRDYIR